MKALFLDRDGIINIDKGYIHKSEDVEFVEGIFDLLKFAMSQGFEFIVVTNQAGVARGMYAESDVLNIHEFMSEKLKEEGITVKEFFHCPHHPEFSGECDCRKPEPGMLLAAKEKYGINMSESLIIGDKRSDVQAGKNAGLGKCILVSSRYEASDVPEADYFARDLNDALKYLKDNFSA
jgi:D-glycero-D-manno-heptose 1,7-bisphosphate phosphatase